MASEFTGVSIASSNVCSGADQTKHQSSALLAFVKETTDDRWFPSQRDSNAANVSIWWRHQDHQCHEGNIGKEDEFRWIPLTKGQWRGALIFSLICARTNGWNNQAAGHLKHHLAHYDVTVMRWCSGYSIWKDLNEKWTFCERGELVVYPLWEMNQPLLTVAWRVTSVSVENWRYTPDNKQDNTSNISASCRTVLRTPSSLKIISLIFHPSEMLRHICRIPTGGRGSSDFLH